MVHIPAAEFEEQNRCMLRPEGCEDVSWIREIFGDPVDVTQDFIRHAFLRYEASAFAPSWTIASPYT